MSKLINNLHLCHRFGRFSVHLIQHLRTSSGFCRFEMHEECPGRRLHYKRDVRSCECPCHELALEDWLDLVLSGLADRGRLEPTEAD